MADQHAQATAAARRHLAGLAGDAADALIELRFRSPGGPMRQRFYRSARLRQAASTGVHLAATHDVYVGCAPRTRRHGSRAAVQRSWVLWADCDTPAATSALADFHPPPSLIVCSGTANNRHAYWLLEQPVDADELEALNRRLAHTLGADEGAYDAARILRLAGTRNHKHQPPTPVALETATGERHTPAMIAVAVADIAVELPPRRQRGGRSERTSANDPLLAVAPAVYVHALTGLQAGRDGKVSCPFHADREPSLHVYPQPARGWYCYGCRRGGSIYDLAAQLWGRDPRGHEFRRLRSHLQALLDRTPPAPRATPGADQPPFHEVQPVPQAPLATHKLRGESANARLPPPGPISPSSTKPAPGMPVQADKEVPR